MTEPLLWFELQVQSGKPIRVYLADEATVPDLVDTYARVYYAANEIYVNVRHDESTFADTVIHELGHLAFNGAFLRSKVEEKHVEAFASVMTHLLQQLGFRLPRKPKGYAALAKKARQS